MLRTSVIVTEGQSHALTEAVEGRGVALLEAAASTSAR